MNSFLDIKEIIEKYNNIIITAHVNPDGDAIGAGLSLNLALLKLGKNSRFILQDKYTSNMEFLSQIKRVEQYSDDEDYNCELVICVDAASKERIGIVERLFENRVIVNIDHHISNTKYGNLNYVENLSSTSEIIYNFLNFLEIEIDLDIAECLYMGLVNDTGNFTHNNVTVKTFEMATHLKKIGVDNSKIVREFFNQKSFSALKLQGIAFEKMVFISEKKFIYTIITKADLDKYNGKKEETEGIVEKILSFKEAEVSLFLREDEIGKFKGSMRSKYDIDVNQIAGIFGGGGHVKAAGFSSQLPSDEIIKIVIDNIKEAK